jgi:hypothetical protein
VRPEKVYGCREIGIWEPDGKSCANEHVNYSHLIERLLRIGHKAPGKSNSCALVIPCVHCSRHEADVKLASVNLGLATQARLSKSLAYPK